MCVRRTPYVIMCRGGALLGNFFGAIQTHYTRFLHSWKAPPHFGCWVDNNVLAQQIDDTAKGAPRLHLHILYVSLTSSRFSI